MIPNYKHDSKYPVDMEEALAGMPEIARQIAATTEWSQYEQKPDLSEIPDQYQKMIPDNIRKNEEDTRIFNMWLTK